MKLYKKFKLPVLLLALGLFANISNAALLVEPHLGYNVSGTGDNGGSTEYDYNGPQYGLRLGYQNLGFMAGLDYTRSSFDMENKSPSSTSTTEMEANEWGFFVGYNFPILIRAWGAYYFSNTTKNKTTNSEATGNTKELGVGFTALPFLSLNLMYRMIALDEYKASTGAKSDIDVSINEIVLGVSLPLTL